MTKLSPPTNMGGEDLYVELGEGNTSLTSQFMDIVNNFQHKLAQLKSSNEQLLKATQRRRKYLDKVRIIPP